MVLFPRVCNALIAPFNFKLLVIRISFSLALLFNLYYIAFIALLYFIFLTSNSRNFSNLKIRLGIWPNGSSLFSLL